MNEEKILNLWRWFYANEQKIKESIDKNLRDEQEIIVQNLDNLILDMGMFSWDIGPGGNNAWFLTISPNGDKELLAKTKEIIAGAPELENWEFNYAKPAKKWDRIFSIYDKNMDVQEVDASKWLYSVINDKDGMIKIALEAQNINYLDNETALKAAELVVLNEIGEEIKICKVSSVDIVKQLDNKHRKTSIGSLQSELSNNLLTNCD